MLAAALVLGACSGVPSDAQRLRPQVLAELAHDRTAFTEGLELSGDVLYESTGGAGTSQLRELDPVTGEVRRAVALPGRLFGEGITVVGDRIWQLTWQDGVALEWDRATLRLLRQVPMGGEGWGLCFDGTRLLRSDGTTVVHFHDPATFAETGSVTVDGARGQLNELECVDGQVWANVWRSTRILRIDPGRARVSAQVDTADLLPAADAPGAEVLNGIAAVGQGEFLLTGKHWPNTYRVRFVDVS